MKRAILLATALAAFLGFASPARQAEASVSVGVSIGTGRHGGFSLSFASRPNVVLIPSSRVYYAPNLDEDLYSYDDEWYYCQDGDWYSADSYDGPFYQVAFTSVPYEIQNIPVSYRRHWGGYQGYNAPVYRAPVTTRYRAPVYTRNYPQRTWGDPRGQWYNRNGQWNSRNDGPWNDRNGQTNDRNGQWGDRNGNNDRQGGNNNGRGNGRGRGNGHGNGHGRNQGNGWGWNR